MDVTRGEDVKPLLKPVLGWAQVGQQIHNNVIINNTEYNNTQQFSFENSEETQNSTASFAKCYCWSTCFWIVITAFTKLFVKGDKLSILACRKRNSHRGGYLSEYRPHHPCETGTQISLVDKKQWGTFPWISACHFVAPSCQLHFQWCLSPRAWKFQGYTLQKGMFSGLC